MPLDGSMISVLASESESFRALLALAERRTGRIPPDRLVRPVLSVTAEAGPATPPAAAGLPPASELRGWLSQLRVERRADGALAIEAPPEAALGLAALFEGMGRLLREAAGGSK